GPHGQPRAHAQARGPAGLDRAGPRRGPRPLQRGPVFHDEPREVRHHRWQDRARGAMKHAALVLGVLVLVSARPAPRAPITAIRAGKIFTSAEKNFDNAVILVEGGKIMAVGNVEIP